MSDCSYYFSLSLFPSLSPVRISLPFILSFSFSLSFSHSPFPSIYFSLCHCLSILVSTSIFAPLSLSLSLSLSPSLSSSLLVYHLILLFSLPLNSSLFMLSPYFIRSLLATYLTYSPALSLSLSPSIVLSHIQTSCFHLCTLQKF